MGGNGAKSKRSGGGAAQMTNVEFRHRLYDSNGSSQELEGLMKQAPEGAVVTVDNRSLGGFSASTAGSAYEFRKTGNGWEEIFGDHPTVSSSRLARMFYNSAGERRRRRWRR